MITGPSLRAHVAAALAVHEGMGDAVSHRDYEQLMTKVVDLQKALQGLGVSSGDATVKDIQQFVKLKTQAMQALKPVRKSIEAMVEALSGAKA